MITVTLSTSQNPERKFLAQQHQGSAVGSGNAAELFGFF